MAIGGIAGLRQLLTPIVGQSSGVQMTKDTNTEFQLGHPKSQTLCIAELDVCSKATHTS